MKPKFNSEKEITDLVKSFEDGTVSREDWHHAEHLAVAFYYLSHHNIDTAYVKMRDGIFNLLRAFSVDLVKEMPYHETLTVFWMRAVSKFAQEQKNLCLLEKTNRLVREFDKDYPLKFYSRDLLFSDRARSSYVEPDLAPIPFTDERYTGEGAD